MNGLNKWLKNWMKMNELWTSISMQQKELELREIFKDRSLHALFMHVVLYTDKWSKNKTKTHACHLARIWTHRMRSIKKHRRAKWWYLNTWKKFSVPICYTTSGHLFWNWETNLIISNFLNILLALLNTRRTIEYKNFFGPPHRIGRADLIFFQTENVPDTHTELGGRI